jgi:hypothetical protein
MKKYKVISPIKLEYGGNTQNPNPTNIKVHEPGSILCLETEAPNGNVWFIDPQGERGNTPAGCVGNLVRVRKLEAI